MNEDDIFNRPSVDVYHKKVKLLDKKYEGPMVNAGSRLYVPLMISHFEIKKSKLYPDKDCLYAQILRRDKDTGELIKELLVTESYDLINDFKEMDEDININGYIGFTKIIKKKTTRNYHATSLTVPEKRKLKGE